jgi:hypothetical protein
MYHYPPEQHSEVKIIITYVSEEFHNFYLSQNIIRQIKSRRMRWAGI